MAADKPRVYWDSCIFIHAFKRTPSHWETIVAIEKQAKSGELDIFVSALVIAEVVNSKAHGKMNDADVRAIGRYFRNKYIKVVPVDRPVASSAADIVRNHDLKPPDAVHVATAIRTQCQVFYTYDGEGSAQGLPLNKRIPREQRWRRERAQGLRFPAVDRIVWLCIESSPPQ
ncbi:MAG: type II toxin-antitoxin system VapC family toxin, partial [Tepidisphaeraceae bacterium]